MYKVLVISNAERIIYEGRDGYTALDVSKKHREKTKFAVVLQTPSGRRFSMTKQDVMMRRLKMAA